MATAAEALNSFGRLPSPDAMRPPPFRFPSPPPDDLVDHDHDLEILEAEARAHAMEQERREALASLARLIPDAPPDDFMDDEDELEAMREMEERDRMMATQAKQRVEEAFPESAREAQGPALEAHYSATDGLQSNGLLDGDDDSNDAVGPPRRPGALQSNGLLGDDDNDGSPDRIIIAPAAPAPANLVSPAPALTWAARASRADAVVASRNAALLSTSSASSSRATVSMDTLSQIPKWIPSGTLSATTFSGQSIRLEKRKKLKSWKPPTVSYGDTDAGLLSRPIHQLMDSVEASIALEVVERNERAALLRKRAIVQESTIVDPASPVVSVAEKKEEAIKGGEMWVNRYQPHKFSELLGDERIHRDVLGWLKEWDPCVFGRAAPQRKQRKFGPNKAGVPEVANNVFPEKAAYKDRYSRPAERVLMISGPPGLGKTTLAHVLANQAGYNVYELNASDARSAGAVHERVRVALESSSMKDQRPTLVVIDEIDGATGGKFDSGGSDGSGAGFIRALVKLIEDGKGSKRKRGGKRMRPLLRPIICICNDLYAPALRPLRPLARLVRFQKPPTAHLVRRLGEICDMEGVQADARTLVLLSELCNNDVRACVTALQFAKSKALAEPANPSGTSGESKAQQKLVHITHDDVRTGSGVKDGNTSVNKVWELLFRTLSAKQLAKRGGGGNFVGHANQRSEAQMSLADDGSSRMSMTTGPRIEERILHEVQVCGDYDRLWNGCFEHYVTLRCADDGWGRYRKAHDWLHFGTTLNSLIFTRAAGTGDLYRYLPHTLVPWHHLFANMGNDLPEWPTADYDHYLKRTAFLETSSALYAGLPASLRILFNSRTVVTELGSTLIRLLSPDLRPINAQLVKTAEKELLVRTVQLMDTLSLNFVQDRLESGQLTYRLEPPLEPFVEFDGKRPADLPAVRFGVRQLVQRELESSRLRKREEAIAAAASAGGPAARSTASKAMAVYRGEDKSRGRTTNAAGPAKKEGKVLKDFFGRVIVPGQPAPGAACKKARKDNGALLDVPQVSAQAAPSEGTDVAAKEASAEAADTIETGVDAMDIDVRAAEDGERETKRIKVYYRFNEGSSNAVRRPVKLFSLL